MIKKKETVIQTEPNVDHVVFGYVLIVSWAYAIKLFPLTKQIQIVSDNRLILGQFLSSK